MAHVRCSLFLHNEQETIAFAFSTQPEALKLQDFDSKYFKQWLGVASFFKTLLPRPWENQLKEDELKAPAEHGEERESGYLKTSSL